MRSVPPLRDLTKKKKEKELLLVNKTLSTNYPADFIIRLLLPLSGGLGLGLGLELKKQT